MRHERPWAQKQGTATATGASPACASGLPGDGEVERAWRELEATATLPSQTHAFHAALSKSMMQGHVSRIEAVRDGDRVVAILPLCRRRSWWARWHATGTPQVFEPVDALCRDRPAADRLAQRLARLSRPLRLDRIPAASLLLPALARAMRGRGLVVARPAQGSPTMPFGPGETDPLQRFNSGRRSDFRRAQRRAEAMGTVAFEMHAPAPEAFDDLYREAVAVEQSGWKGDAGSALGSDSAKEAFFRDFLRGASREGQCRIAFMRIDGKAVAMQLAVAFQRRYWLFKIGFDARFARCSPGNLLMLHAMADAMAHGLLGVELLGEVEPWIVEAWTQEAIGCLRVQTYPFNLRGLAMLMAEGAAWAWHRLPFVARAEG